MRITRIDIGRWRNLRAVTLAVPDDSRIVCLVGENGSGKSTVLELLSAAAYHLGISPGIEMPRGNPFGDPHDVVVEAIVSKTVVEQAKAALVGVPGLEEWSGGLRFASRRDESGSAQDQVHAVGVADMTSAVNVGANVVNILRAQSVTQHLYLDADRAYPPMQIQPHQFGDIWGQDWSSPEWNKQWAYRPTRTLYEEWNKYFIGTEERVATEYVSAVRRAKNNGTVAPEFADPFDGYKKAVSEVLPHLLFAGVQSHGLQRTIIFDSAGLEIPFSQLSGGEREIAFLIGQIERFGLRTGLLMIDEPELHLNPDLLRTWVAFLRDTVQDGQVWMATHSLEAVEVTGPEASFVFEKDATDRLTRSVVPLAGRPAVSALSAAVGAPAFSISKLRFVFVEGDRQSRERERFFDLCGDPAINRFIEGGSCHEVLRRLDHVRELAAETGEQLRVGGVIDRDFRSDEDASFLSASHGVHVLGCHEVENLYLHPEALDVLCARASVSKPVTELLRAASDTFAGLWVAQRADSLLPDLSATPKATMSALGPHAWQMLVEDVELYATQSASHFSDTSDRDAWRDAVERAVAEYDALRNADDLWARCLGKQVQGHVATQLGFANVSALQRHLLRIWHDETVAEPPELVSVQRYVSQLTGS